VVNSINRTLKNARGRGLKISDTVLAILSDMHTGGSTALFPRGGYCGDGDEDNHVMPNAKQQEIFPVFVRFAAEVAAARKDKRLILVMLGDAVDGLHHDSKQESLFKEKDQNAAHIQLMQDFMKRVGWRKGDELYYVRGTEVHVKESEQEIGKELGAVKAGSKAYVHEILSLNINGMQHTFAHHGKDRGAGANEGNALRNYMRDIRIDREKEGLPRIDCLWSGHTHGHTYQSHIARAGANFHVFHAVICPSWQAKTRYAFMKVPLAVNSVGGVYVKIGADGTMSVPRFVVQTTRDE
jgi:hypothetical protein